MLRSLPVCIYFESLRRNINNETIQQHAFDECAGTAFVPFWRRLSPDLQVHVPFAFMVGTQQFAAGDYRVQQADSGVLFVQGEGKAVAAITLPADLKPRHLEQSSIQQR